MDKKKVFDILDIAETKDVNIIKTAYRKKLVHTNPEDNPEEFKTLREAYEEAMRLIDVQEEETLSDTPIRKWIQKVENVYKKLSTRTNVASWKELFEDEICKDFDASDEAKEAFLVFLMEHYRLSAEVWELIEETFQLIDSKEELYEKFPVNFVNFITDTPESKGWLDLTLFEGDEAADVDEFINQYLSIRRMNDYNEYEKEEEVFEKLEKINLWHPYLEIEKMRYYLTNKKIKEAVEIAETLRLKKYEDLYVKYYIATVSIDSGDIERAYEECKAILEVNPNHFGAKSILCSYYLEKKEYKKSKEGYIELLEIDSYNEPLIEGLKKANQGLIAIYKEQLENDPDNKELKLELGWCLFQNDLCEECVALVEGIEINEEIRYNYYNLMSRTYMRARNYEKAYLYIKKWLEEILKVQDDGTEETQSKLRRLALAYYLMSNCYYNFSIEKENKKEDLHHCIQYLDLAIEAEGKGRDLLKYLSEKAHALLKLEEYKLCIDICDEILSLNQTYFPAYLYRQEACFNLKMGKEVIDDFYNAIEIYAGDVKPYLLAAKVFMAYDQYEDAEGVIKRAKDAGIESNELDLQELILRRIKAETYEERKVIAKEIDKFYAKVQEQLGDLEDISAVLHELALCYYHMEEGELALEAIERKLQLHKSDGSLVLKGDILYNLENYEEAIAIYKEITDRYADYEYGYYQIGNCYEALGEEEAAIDNYLKVLELDPGHRFVHNELMQIYKRRYKSNYRQEDYKLALDYGKRQVEIIPNCYYYNELGLLYLDGYDLEAALKAFEEAYKHDETDMYAYNNIGFTYKILRNYDAAYKYYKLAIEHQQNGDLITHWNIGKYYRITEQYEKAIETYESIAPKCKNPKDAIEELADLYCHMGEWDKAVAQYQKIFDLTEAAKYKNPKFVIKKFIELYRQLGMDEAINEYDRLSKLAKADTVNYLIHVGYVHLCAGNYKEALSYYKKAIRKYPHNSKPYSYMGNYMLWILGNPQKALKYYKKAYIVAKRCDPKSDDYLDDLLHDIVYALKALGKEEKAKQYVEELYRYTEKHYGSIDKWLNNPGYRKIRLCYIAIWNYNTGQYEKAKYYMDLMKETVNCRMCSYADCHEYYRLEGMRLELQEDYQGALEKYQKALDISPDNIYNLGKVKEIQRKVRDKQI